MFDQLYLFARHFRAFYRVPFAFLPDNGGVILVERNWTPVTYTFRRFSPRCTLQLVVQGPTVPLRA